MTTYSPQFLRAMQLIAQLEWDNQPDGEPSDDPNDPGGHTQYGLSQVYNQGLQYPLTLDQATTVYWQKCWIGSGCANISDESMAIAHFQASVNPGIGASAYFMKNSKTALEYLGHQFAHYAVCESNHTDYKGLMNRVVKVGVFLGVFKT